MKMTEQTGADWQPKVHKLGQVPKENVIGRLKIDMVVRNVKNQIHQRNGMLFEKRLVAKRLQRKQKRLWVQANNDIYIPTKC